MVYSNDMSKKEDKKKQIVKAGLKLFLKSGFHNCRIEDIVEKAKVGKGTFYLHFKNKEDLVCQLMDIFISEVKETLEWVMDNLDENTPLQTIFEEEARRLVMTFDANKSLAKFMFREGRSVSAKIDKKISAFYLEIITLSETTFAFAAHAGLINKVHPKVAATCVVGGITQLYTQYLEGDFEEEDCSIEQLTDSAIEFFIFALGVKPNQSIGSLS